MMEPTTHVSIAAVRSDATAQVRKQLAVSRKYTSSVCTAVHLVRSRQARIHPCQTQLEQADRTSCIFCLFSSLALGLFGGN